MTMNLGTLKQRIRIAGYVSPVALMLGLGLYYVNGLWDSLSLGFALLGALGLVLYAVICFDDLREVFSARSFRSGTNTMLLVCLVLSLLVVVNVVGYRHFVWKDITVAGKFELSPLTGEILEQVRRERQEIFITAFFWTNVDRNLSLEQNQVLVRANRDRQLKLSDLLAVYHSVNPLIQYRVVDPNQDMLLARQYDVGRYRDNVTVVERGEVRELVPDMESEEHLTNALIRVLSGEKRRIYFLEGHQEASAEDGSESGFLMAAAAIRDQSYEVLPLNVMETGRVPEDCRVLLIPGVRKPLLPEEINLIDNYLGQGGKAMILLDPEYQSGLDEWLLNWGVRVGSNLVVDNSAAGVRQGAGPTEPLLYNYDREHPVTRQLMKAFTTMPTVRSVQPVDTPPENVVMTVLATTSENSWVRPTWPR